MLSEQVLNWVVTAIGSNAKIHSVRVLPGATSSLLYSITDDSGRKFVLRQCNNQEWLQEEPNLAVHEAENLKIAAQIGIATPRLIAFDKDGSVCGMPSILMTHLEGEVVLNPPNMGDWVQGLAETLGQIHTMKPPSYSFHYFGYVDIKSFAVPSWSKIPQLWEKAIDYIKNFRPKAQNCFIHRDYHPTNVLWYNDKVSGVVDWPSSCIGPAGVDVGHCRVNLAQLFGVEVADQFLNFYKNYVDTSFIYEAYWDLVSLVDILTDTPPQVYQGWRAFGVKNLTDELIRDRLDRYFVSLVNREDNLR